MKKELRRKAENKSEKVFLKSMSNSVFEKTMENVRKWRDIKLVTTEARKNYLISEPNYYIKKKIFRKFISHRHEKSQIFMKKSVYVGLSILEWKQITLQSL